MSIDALVPDFVPVREINEMGGEVVVRGLTKEQFIHITERFPDFRMEREKNGDITIMAPVKGGTSYRENNLSADVTFWNRKAKAGLVFGANAGFDLPDGATKCPDFVAELRSKSDRLAKVKEKMLDTWMANGVRLAWLIDPYKEKAYIYRQNGAHETVTGFDNKLSGEDVMPGLKLDLSEFRLLTKK
jgi:Uma2 family endonuclease